MANATYQPANVSDPLKSTGNGGNACVYHGSAATLAALATTDKVRPCRIPAGTKIHRVVVKNPDLDSGANLAVNIGVTHIDGSAATTGEAADLTARSLTQATLVAAAATTWQAAATTTYEIFPPFLVEVDSYLQCVPTVAGATNTGTIYAKVEGEAVGVA